MVASNCLIPIVLQNILCVQQKNETSEERKFKTYTGLQQLHFWVEYPFIQQGCIQLIRSAVF